MKRLLTICMFILTALLIVSCNQKVVNVTFMVEDQVYYQEKITKGERLNLPADPTKDNGYFSCWKKGDEVFDINLPINEDLTLVASFIKLDNQAVVRFFDNQTLLATTTVALNTTIKSFPNTSKTGFKFDGWYLESGCLNKYQDQPITKNTDIFGKWENNIIETHLVSFYDGTSLVKQEEVAKNTAILNFPKLTKSGFKVEGWYLDEQLTTKYQANLITAPTSLYAKWVVNEVKDYDGYYKGYNLEGKSSDALLNNLKKRLYDGTNIRSYGGNLNSILTDADVHPTKSGYVYTIYDGAAMSRTASGSGGPSVWNKEHVIPRSWFNSKGYQSHEGDVHNLRISRASINSDRGNLKFGIATGSWNKNAGGGFYPGDDHRGDCARIAMYMLVMMPDALSIKNMIANDDGRTLLKWHLEDPIDDFEIKRNEVLFNFQGNRNPFIDHPEFAGLIWENLSSEAKHRLRTIITHHEAIISELKGNKFYI